MVRFLKHNLDYRFFGAFCGYKHLSSRIPTKYYSCLPDTPLPPQKFAPLQVGFKTEDPPSFYTLPSFGNLFFKKMQMLRVVGTTRRLCVAPMSEATGYALALNEI